MGALGRVAPRPVAPRWVAVALLVVMPALALPRVQVGQAALVAAYAVAVLGVNLIVGFTGQISLGHGAFVGVGAYTTVILSADHGWPLVLTVPAAFMVGFVVGSVIGLPALRLRGLYLALMTLGVGVAFGPVVKRLDSITNGAGGKGTSARIEAPSWFGSSRLADARWNYLVIAVVGLVVFLLCRNLVTGVVGRSLAALRENELSAVSFGIDVARHKVVMFGVSAGVAAVAGSMFMLREPFAIDTTYDQRFSIVLYTAAFIGGVTSVPAAVIGGLVIVGVPLVLDAAGVIVDTTLVYGAALVLITLFAPDGLPAAIGRVRLRRA
jgi:branched-chain amino acid transport system permease protein